MTPSGRALLRKLRLGDAWDPYVESIEDEARAEALAAVRAAVEGLTHHPDCICGGEKNRSPTVSLRRVLAAIDKVTP